MEKVFVRLTNPSNSYTDIEQGAVISGPKAVEVLQTPKINNGVNNRAIEILSSKEAKAHNAELEETSSTEEKAGYASLKYEELVAVAKEKGIAASGKKTAKIIEELEALDSKPEGEKEEYQKVLEGQELEALKLGAIDLEVEHSEDITKEELIKLLVEKKFAA